MNQHMFDLPPAPSAAVNGIDARFPIYRIFCVGRNYEAHAAEMGTVADREAPFYFTKSARAYCPSGATIPYPPGTANFHHEMEFVITIGKSGFRIPVSSALDHVFGYACGLDLTRRDLQNAAKDKGRPWDLGKDFENSAVLAPITRATEFGEVASQQISLSVNGAERQRGALNEMVFNVAELIADLSSFYHLQPGDLIYTGTPAGVAPLAPGDVVYGEIDGLSAIELTIGAAN